MRLDSVIINCPAIYAGFVADSVNGLPNNPFESSEYGAIPIGASTMDGKSCSLYPSGDRHIGPINIPEEAKNSVVRERTKTIDHDPTRLETYSIVTFSIDKGATYHLYRSKLEYEFENKVLVDADTAITSGGIEE